MGFDEKGLLKNERCALERISRLTHSRRFWLLASALAIFTAALLARLSNISHGMDQWDVVLYKNSLVDMHFYREAQWPLLLLFQKGLWLLMPHHSPQSILSLTSLLSASGILALVFILAYQITKSFLSALAVDLVLFFMPIFGVYSVIGMQDMPQALGVTLLVAVCLQYCFSANRKWLYASALTGGLVLGIRPTLAIAAPIILAAMLMIERIHLKLCLKTAGFYLLGAAGGLAGELFIPPLAHSSSWRFFMGEFHMFNPTVLGYWSKAGQYPLFSGDKFTIFYWIPILWVIIYLMSRYGRKKLSVSPLIALSGGLISLAVAYGLRVKLKSIGAGAPAAKDFILPVVLFVLALVYEFLRFVRRFPGSHYFKKSDGQERAILLLSLLIIIYIVYNFAFAESVLRYFLPVIPSLLLLGLLLINKTGIHSWPLVILIIAVSYWGCSFFNAQRYVGEFKKLDTRTSVAEYVQHHPGRYYDYDATLTVQTYVSSLNPNKTEYASPPGGCIAVDFKYANYALFYGPATQSVMSTCPKVSFIEVAKFQRTENIIEDNVGNLGFTIYKLAPAPST